jgi:hypothetical protein
VTSIGALAANATPHSTFVRSLLLLVGWKRSATHRKELRQRRDDDRRRETGCRKAEVTLGVDTHLDTHVAVALDHLLGRRLGELRVCPRRPRATREPAPLGSEGFRHCEVCRGRANQQLRGWDHSLPEDRGDRADGKSSSGRSVAPPPSSSQQQQQVRLTGRRERCPHGE